MMEKIKILKPIWGLEKGAEVELDSMKATFAVNRGRAEYIEYKKADVQARGRKKKIDIEAEKLLNKSL